jgi:hypothetical protein
METITNMDRNTHSIGISQWCVHEQEVKRRSLNYLMDVATDMLIGES